MKSKGTSISRIAVAFVVCGLALVIALPASTVSPKKKPKGKVQDWTNHHLVFSHPGTKEQAIEKGEYDRWLKIVNNPRYIQQQENRNSAPSGLIGAAEPALERISEPDFATGAEMTIEQRSAAQLATGGMSHIGLARAPGGVTPSIFHTGPTILHKNRMKKDWSEDMGSGATVGLGDFPATYTTGGTSCSDFAVYNTGLTGSSSQASIIAYNNLYASCNGGTPTTYFAYNTGGTITNGVVLYVDGEQVAFEQANASGVATLGIAKLASGGTASAPVAPTSVTPAAYPTCNAPCMTTITFNGSPTDTYSFPYYDNGSDAIFVGDDSGALHLFYNVFNEFQLGSAPTEIVSVYWPKQVTSTSGVSALGSPVYDATSGNVFIGDYILNSEDTCEPSASESAYTCGYLYSVGYPVSTVTRSAQLDYNIGILDSPIVDSSAGKVYAFVGDDGTTNCSSGPCAGVFEFSTTFSSAATGTEAAVGSGYEFMMSGTFDNLYYTSESPAATGSLYVVGNTGASNNTLYQIPITASTMGTPVAGPVVATNYSNSYYSAGLQITEFYNTGGTQPHDYIFLSVLSYGNPTSACGTPSSTIGCILGYDVTTVTAATPITSSTAPTGGLPEAGGTSGIIVDNGSSGASNIYFSTLLNQSCTGPGVTGTGGCAVQTTQSAP